MVSKNSNKIPPSAHKSTCILHNISSYGKHGYLRTKNCTCLNSTHVKSNANALKGKDGATINPLMCNKCSNIMHQCQTCGTLRNICTELKAAKRHLRDYHKLENNTVNAIEGNDIEESTEIELAIEGDCDVTDLEQDIRNLNLTSDLNDETDAHREFMKHFHNENAREYLVAISQDKHFSEMRCKNLSKVDVSLQIKLSKLHSLLSPSEQLELAEITRLLMQSLQERESNDALYAFTIVPSTNNDIQRMCLRGKYSILQNIPKPSTDYDGDLCVISAVEAIKNALLLGLDVTLIRATHCVEDMDKCINNSVSDGKKMREEIVKLAEKCNKTDKEVTIVPCSQFRDGFLPCKSVASNEGLLLHTVTIQSRDSACDSSTCTCPVALGTKSKDSMITESTFLEDWNIREDPTKPFKACSKQHKSFINIVCYDQCMSMDQIEKRAHTLFSGGNSKFGAYFGYSCCYDDISSRLVPCKTCNNKSLKGVNNDKCNKCWNFDITKAKYSKQLVTSTGGFVKKPFKLTMSMQREKSTETFESIVNENLSVTMAREQLKTSCVPGDAIKLIIDTAVIMHAKKTDTLHMHDLSSFHHLIDKRNLDDLSFPDFASYRRQNLTCDKFSSSPMHMIDLGELEVN